jgi:CRP-like cAMP-binding protein
MIADIAVVVKSGICVLVSCKEAVDQFVTKLINRFTLEFSRFPHNMGEKVSFLEDKCQPFWEICHFKTQTAFINIVTMFRQDYARFSIFAGLSGDQINQLSPFMVECHFCKDQVIFDQGQPAEYLFILLSGEVVIDYKPYDGPPLTVAHIKPGGVFGWSSALQRDVYTSGAIAHQESLACRLRGADLNEICSLYPDTGKLLLERLASVIARRLRSTHTQVLDILTQSMDANGKNLKRSSKNDRK